MNPLCITLLAVAVYMAVMTRVRTRWVGWLALLGMLAGLSWLWAEELAVVRMVVLCVTLLIGMKAMVYAEWRRSHAKLPRCRWLFFTLLWFGMNPGVFVRRVEKLEWKSHAVIGLVCTLVGGVLSVAVSKWNGAPLVCKFIPLSLGFHFGVLRLMTAFWRAQGFPVRALFRNPLVARGVGDFWAKRWNLSFSQMMVRCVQRPLVKPLGRRGASMAVFLVSGLLHEVAISLPVQSGYGLPTAYFALHGFFMSLEKSNWSVWLTRPLALLLVVLPLPLLFPKAFTAEVIDVTLYQLEKLSGSIHLIFELMALLSIS